MKIIEITKWRSQEIKTIALTQDVGGASYQLQVREFIPEADDSLSRSWTSNGTRKYHPCAPYAIVNMQEAGYELVRFVDNHISGSIEHYIDETDKLLRDTYAMAYRYSQIAEVCGVELPPNITRLISIKCIERRREMPSAIYLATMDGNSYGISI